MPAKILLYDEEARRALQRGVEKVASAVRVTLGPRGRNVVLEKKWGSPTITKDGVTVAKEIELEDPNENMGAQLVKEVASKTNDLAGDGTTTATVLAWAIVREGLRNVAAGSNPMLLKRGIDKAVDAVVDELKKISITIEGKQDIAHVAGIAANDTDVGDIIADAMEKVGKDGVITIEEGKGIETTVEVVEGMQFESVEIDMLGRAEKVKADKDDTTVIGGKGDRKDIQGRIAQIKKEIEDTTSDYDREKLQERLAKLSGGVAEIKVGAATETEMKEKKHRFEDALNATKAAVEEGVVPGGGTAYIRALPALDKIEAEADEAIGANLVRRALEEPARQLAANAGVEGSLIVERLKRESGRTGYDVAKGEFADMIKAGIVDPTKVTRLALQNAASVAGLLLTTEAIVVEKREKRKAAMPAPGGGMPEDEF